MPTLVQRISDLATAIGTDIKSLWAQVNSIPTTERLSITRSNVDNFGVYTTIEWKRVTGNTLKRKTVLSGGTAPNYTTITETLYDTNGTTVLSTATATLTYDSTNNVLTDSTNPGYSSEIIQLHGISTRTSFSNLSVFGTDVTPPVGVQMKLAMIVQGGKTFLSTISSLGEITQLQTMLYSKKIHFWNTISSGTTLPGIFGMPAPSTVGTATARSLTYGNAYSMAKRMGYVSSATAGSLCGIRSAQAGVIIASGSVPCAGFFVNMRFGIADSVGITARSFFGISTSVAAPTNVEPTTLKNCLGVVTVNNGQNLHFYSAGSTAQSAIDLGSSFGTATGGINLFSLSIFSPNTGTPVIYWELENIITKVKTSGSITTGFGSSAPPTNTLMSPFNMWRSNNAVAAAVGIDILSIYYETEY